MPKIKNRNVAKQRVIDATRLSLQEWLFMINITQDERDYLIEDSHFPTDAHREEYLSTIAERSDREIKLLLKSFLITHGTLGNDALIRKILFQKSSAEKIKEYRLESDFLDRLLTLKLPWDGMNWILDLLPDYPQEALKAISAYFLAHIQFLPDGRYHGLSDAEAIIRCRYLNATHSPEMLMAALTPREFEQITAECFTRLGDQVELGSGSRDGGIDVKLIRKTATGTEIILIQCKLYNDPVGVAAIRDLKGTIEAHHANKGIMITSSTFTADAIAFANTAKRVELVDFPTLDRLFNEAFGARWPTLINTILNRMRRKDAAPRG